MPIRFGKGHRFRTEIALAGSAQQETDLLRQHVRIDGLLCINLDQGEAT
jgi:hypothetical protein